MLRGWRLLSDEVALIRPGTREVLPVPRPIALKEVSIEVIRDFDSRAVLGPSCAGTRKGTVAHLRPTADSVRRSAEPADPAWLVTLVYEPNVVTDLRPVTRAEMLLRLGNNAFNYSMVGLAGFETLSEVVDKAACFELHYGDLEEAVSALGTLTLDPTGRTSGTVPAIESAQ
jgi:HprK-related kinase A